MKNFNINQFHDKINKSILLLEAHIEIKNLSFIIKSCRLKPWLVLDNDTSFMYKIMIHNKWFDEFGNSVEIDKKNKINVIYNDLKIERNKIICTDFYSELSMEKIIKMSKFIHLYIGYQDEEIFCYVTLMGIDNFLRTYLYDEGRWIYISPLILGVDRLFKIREHLDVKFFLKFKKKKNIFFPCEAGEEWISFLPASVEFMNMLAKKYELNIFKL